MAKATAVRVSTGKKFSQLLIITPAVAIDNNNDGGYSGPFHSHDSGCGSSGGSDASLDESDGSNERINGRGVSSDRNNNDKSNRLKLLPKVRQHIVTKVTSSSAAMGGCGGGGAGNGTHSWRWCSIICSAVRCFRAATHSQQHFGTIHYSSNAAGVELSNGADNQMMGDRGRNSIRNPLTSSRMALGGGGSSRFSSNHIYEYTIKSYRSGSNDHDHINNNSNSSGGNHSGGDSTDRSNIMYKL